MHALHLCMHMGSSLAHAYTGWHALDYHRKCHTPRSHARLACRGESSRKCMDQQRCKTLGNDHFTCSSPLQVLEIDGRTVCALGTLDRLSKGTLGSSGWRLTGAPDGASPPTARLRHLGFKAATTTADNLLPLRSTTRTYDRCDISLNHA